MHLEMAGTLQRKREEINIARNTTDIESRLHYSYAREGMIVKREDSK